MKKLTESDVVRMMREEWEERLIKLSEDVDVALKADIKSGKKKKEDKVVISPDLVVTSKKTGIEYTVYAVSPVGCTLVDPEGRKVSVNADKLEKLYELK